MELENQIVILTGVQEEVTTVKAEHEGALYGMGLIQEHWVPVMKFRKENKKWYIVVGEFIR